MLTWSTCQRACAPAWFTCQRAKNMPASHFYVPTCHTACQCFNLACQRAKWRANFSTWRVNVPKSVPVFQTFLLRNAKWNFYTLLLYEKFYIILDIIVMHMICICIVNKNFTILHFYSSWLPVILKESVWDFFFFIIFFFVAL